MTSMHVVESEMEHSTNEDCTDPVSVCEWSIAILVNGLFLAFVIWLLYTITTRQRHAHELAPPVKME